MKVSAFVAPLVAIVCALALVANQASAQGLRRQMRAQKKLEKKLDRQNSDQENLATANGTRSEAAPARPTTPQAEKHSLDGIRQRGIRSFFTQEEATLIIPGFAQSPVALLIIFRQLDLTPEQKERIRNIRRRVGRSLVQTRSELAMLEQQLDEAIYGTNDPGSLDNYDPKRVEELAERVAVKRVELMKLQTGIESQLRQILTPDQFFVFKELIREILLPGRRPGAAIQRQQQMQRRMGVPQN